MRLKDFAVKVLVNAVEKIIEPIENVKFSAACFPFFDRITQLILFNNATILCNADEDDAIQQTLNDFVQLLGREAGIVLVNIFGQFLAPFGHLVEESRIA